MGRRSKASSTTKDSDFDFYFGDLDFGGGFGADASDATVKTERIYTAEQIEERMKSAAHRTAQVRYMDGGFVTEIVGTPEEVQAVRRLALYSRDRDARAHLFREFYADEELTGSPVEVLPAEYVLLNAQLLEKLHLAVCGREGWPADLTVEEVIDRLQEIRDPVAQIARRDP